MEGNEIGSYLKKIHNHLERGKNSDLKRYSLTGTQLEALLYLRQKGEKTGTLSEMAQFFDVKHTSILHVVKLLEKKGLIARAEKKPGSRLREIRLTESGHMLMEEMERIKSEVDGIMLTGMSCEERAVLQRLLAKLYRNLKEGDWNGR